MTDEFMQRLVDLYVGDELPQELVDELEAAAAEDPALSHDMFTLKRTLSQLRASYVPEFTEESHYRILMRMQKRGMDVETKAPDAAHWQYTLPMQG